MLGVEPERHADFKRWSDCIISGVTGAAAGLRPESLLQAFKELSDYLTGVIDARRAQPREDLISTLTRAEAGETALTPAEILMFTILLLVAGNETTTNLLGNAMLALLAHPDELARVQRDPGLIPGLVEEVVALRRAGAAALPPRHAGRRARGNAHPRRRHRGAADRLGQPRRRPVPGSRSPRRDAQSGRATSASASASTSASAPRSRASKRVSRSRSCSGGSRLSNATQPHVEYIDSFLVRGPKSLPLRFGVA